MRAWVLAGLVILAGCGGGGGGGSTTQAPPPVAPAAASETVHDVVSTHTGITYRVIVRTPQGYAGVADRRPVVYAPDLEFQHAVLATTVDSQGLGAIIVSVSQVSVARRFVLSSLGAG